MASLLKNQILKHLSKFVKNLSPSQINLSTLKGEGELTGLELNCAVLTQLLELPAWIRLVSASCNKAAVRIQWTKLKTVPIQLYLDEIRVEVETCEELRQSAGDKLDLDPVSLPTQGQGYYGFTDKVVDGMYVSVNLVYINLTSMAFVASFQMSRIVVESKSPNWSKASLPHTRLKDMDRGEVLVFKEISWQTVRIEARSTVATELTPLRLITNQARCRITLKKRMADCSILGVRLVTILDDLLWVLTDDQLKAALHFVGSISGLVRKVTESTQKEKAARKLNKEVPKKTSQANLNPASKMFQKYDVIETSYHLYSDRIDLHFCDDPGRGRSEHPELEGGGAFQVSLARLQIDFYPYHLARGDRRHWVRYNDESNHRSWLLSNLTSFDTKLLDVVMSGQTKTPLHRAGKAGHGGRVDQGGCDEAFRDLVVSQLARLMTSNIIMRLGDLTLWRVSTSSNPSSKKSSEPLEMLKGDSIRLHLPRDLPLIHLELTQFYYPGDVDFPIPSPSLLMTLNPITVWFDLLTLVWLNSFSLNLQKSVTSLQESLQLEQNEGAYVDIKVEMLMPRLIVLPRSKPSNPHRWRPENLQISASKVSLSNYRSLEAGSRADLANTLDKFQQSTMFFGVSFPCSSSDPSVVCEKFWSHATGADNVREPPNTNTSTNDFFQKDLLWVDARDVWHCSIASVWAEFNIPALSSAPVPLLDATPLVVWLYVTPPEQKHVKESRPNKKLLSEFYGETKKEFIGLHLLVFSNQLISVQLDHHQLLFLLRLVETLSEMGAFLSSDSQRISAPNPVPGMVIGAMIPQLDVNIVLPGSSSVCAISPDNNEAIPRSQDSPQCLETEVEVPEIHEESSDCLEMPKSPVKLQLQSTNSNGFFTNSPLYPGSSDMKSKNLTSSLNSKMDGLSGGHGSPCLSGLRSPDLDIDSMSVRSDESGDSNIDTWTMVSSNIDIGEVLFRVNKSMDDLARGPSPAEMAEEVCEEKSLDGSERINSKVEEKRIISVLTFHLSKLSLAQVSGEKSSALMLDVSSLSSSLAEDQEYLHFQSRFGQSGKSWSDNILFDTDESILKIRIESDNLENPRKALSSLAADIDVPLGEKISRLTNGNMAIEVNSLNLPFLSSTLSKLADWSQDEIIPAPLPMDVKLRNVLFNITDDAPVTPGCPQQPPVCFNIEDLYLTRDKKGVFHVKPSVASASTSKESSQTVEEESPMRKELDLALAEISLLRSKLAEKDGKIAEWEQKCKEMSTTSSRHESQIEGLVEEKKSMISTMKYLQDELLKSGKK